MSAKASRNWVITILAFAAAVFIGWAAVVCWKNLHHDPFMWGAAIILTLSSGTFLLAAVTGKAEDFFLALVGWW